jgi:hypothetical protein
MSVQDFVAKVRMGLFGSSFQLSFFPEEVARVKLAAVSSRTGRSVFNDQEIETLLALRREGNNAAEFCRQLKKLLRRFDTDRNAVIGLCGQSSDRVIKSLVMCSPKEHEALQELFRRTKIR